MAANGTNEPDDATLLAAIGRLWEQLDPPPAGLADGVLARIAAEDLEYELLTLVEGEGALAGVRHAAPEERDDGGAWLLEYEGHDLRVYVRLTRIEERTRLDGWVVPARPVLAQLRPEGSEQSMESEVDEFGRFEFASVQPGTHRLTFTDIPRGRTRPMVTPPFWI